MNRLQKLLALSPYQWYLLISAMILLPSIRLSIKFSGFKKTYNRVVASPVNIQTIELNKAQIDEAQQITRMIDIAAAHGLYRANCLTRSLLLLRMLKKRNIPCQLMIGTNEGGNSDKNNFGAHAWIESEGKVLNDQSDISTRFKAFPLPKGLLK